MNAHASFLLDPDDTYRIDAHRTAAGTVIGAVILNERAYSCIQSRDPAALRKLAMALLDAADQAELLLTTAGAA